MISKIKRISSRETLGEFKRLPCLICGATPSDPSHIKTKGSGGHDCFENLKPLCRLHHREWEDSPKMDFLTRYPAIVDYLLMKGWDYCTFSKKLVNERKTWTYLKDGKIEEVER